jgi:hypothetical protein
MSEEKEKEANDAAWSRSEAAKNTFLQRVRIR